MNCPELLGIVANGVWETAKIMCFAYCVLLLLGKGVNWIDKKHQSHFEANYHSSLRAPPMPTAAPADAPLKKRR